MNHKRLMKERGTVLQARRADLIRLFFTSLDLVNTFCGWLASR